VILNNKLNVIKSFFRDTRRNNLLPPRKAYEIWAECYDNEKDNLILYYDEIILKKLMGIGNLSDKTILDFGSGTGRNWNEIIQHHPRKIIGCDISPEMITKLKKKFPDSETYIIKDEKLDFLKEKECDTIISTLVISHIKDIKKLFLEWNRVMKDNGDIIITDFHPDLFVKGGSRTFKFEEKTYTVEHYIHEVPLIIEMFLTMGFRKVNFIEKLIDEEVKSFYLKKNALHIYERFKGIPFIYGLLLRR